MKHTHSTLPLCETVQVYTVCELIQRCSRPVIMLYVSHDLRPIHTERDVGVA